MITVRPLVLGLAACAAAVLLAACARENPALDQMSWARAALQRNPQLTIESEDAKSHTFTVRLKDTGESRVVSADAVVAAPLPSSVMTAAATNPAAAPAADAATAPAGESAAADAGANAAAPADSSATLGTPYNSAAAQAAVHPSGNGRVIESGPGYSIESASPAQAQPAQSGPGYTITRVAGPAPVASAGRLRDPGVTSAALERRREPIVCQGARMLHIDNRNLEFDGDAVSAEDGCEIYITNSHITATGVGLTARNAQIHIDNSLIEGDGGSIDASQGAQVYAASSHFRGLSRRLDSAAFHDQGGNIWN
ncbi:MAG: hypothetical protein JSS29_17375 [Proteobacteria bacterium]|nr:hypothetical protein [Pseudomonadota bacterium]